MKWSWVSTTLRRLIPVGLQVHMTRYPDLNHLIDEHEGVMVREFLTNYMPAPTIDQQLAAQSDERLQKLGMDTVPYDEDDDEEDEGDEDGDEDEDAEEDDDVEDAAEDGQSGHEEE